MKPFILRNNMSKLKDITGFTFGRLTVLHLTESRNNKPYWMCLCLCGKQKEVTGANLKTGHTQSCGCFKVEQTKKARTTHGDTKGKNRTSLYSVWLGMRSRCTNHKSTRYMDYGGRGITVDPVWDDFPTFREWALINGYAPELQIDRTNNNKGYSPNNCRWVTRTINVRNIRSHKGASSKYIGVHWFKNCNKWLANITVNKKRISIGYFSTELEAAQARDAYVKANNLEGFTINLT